MLMHKSRDGTRTTHLIDFGFATRDGDSSMSLACGSLPYAAPELLAGKGYSKNVDVWSAGILLYTMLLGTTPYNQVEKTRIKSAIANGQIEYPEDMYSKLSIDAQDILSRMLTLDPSKRWSAAQILRHPWLQSEGRVGSSTRWRYHVLRTASQKVGENPDFLYRTYNVIHHGEEKQQHHSTHVEYERHVTGKDFPSSEELRDARLWRATLAEFLGTFLLIVVGISVELLHHDNVLLVAIAWGLLEVILIFVFEEISGAQLNPGTSFGTFLAGKQSLLRTLFFTLVQFIAGLLAVPMMMALLSPDLRHDDEYRFCVTEILAGNRGRALVVETFITFLFVFVDFSLTLNPIQPIVVSKVAAPFAIGATMTLNALLALHITGASGNAARSFGPAVYAGYWKDHWIYWVGCYLGAALAAILFRAFIHGNDNEKKEE
ncbi:hypothetical protein PROFUN_01138 [Planoprotostelium fungivorum]|uniref:Protein kinase domain-containing protein n=1 Tax=Planoprotostelium fungivorum TaxID=1890364 RepID=A0A2P6NCD9_9EUKA|nr:hypothetical protein PROFUN_01138 [Planoprotostelium fungivorum]